MVYITIPSLESIPSQFKLADGSLDPRKNTMENLLPRYTVREVALVRIHHPFSFCHCHCQPFGMHVTTNTSNDSAQPEEGTRPLSVSRRP